MTLADMTDDALRHLEPEMITTPDDAKAAMMRLDDIVADITHQVSEAKRAANAGEGLSDHRWLTNAERALRGAKASRQIAQQRLGELNREAKAARAQSPTCFSEQVRQIIREEVGAIIRDELERAGLLQRGAV